MGSASSWMTGLQLWVHAAYTATCCAHRLIRAIRCTAQGQPQVIIPKHWEKYHFSSSWHMPQIKNGLHTALQLPWQCSFRFDVAVVQVGMRP